jgi:hypothetical protein
VNATLEAAPATALNEASAVRRELDLPAVVPVSWALAGGMGLGGITVALLVMNEKLSAHALIAASAVFFSIGAAAGLLHGVLLGVFGRPDGVTPRQALRSMLHGVIYLVPLLLLGWLTAGWAAALPIVIRGRHLFAGAITIAAWMFVLVALVIAASSGLEAAKNAYRRWPDRVPGSLLVGLVLVSLVTAFAIETPTVWFWHLKLTGFGAALFAFVLTFWFYGPIITTALALLRKLRERTPAAARRPLSWSAIVTRGGIALGAGVALAVLAVPFHFGALGLPTTGERLGIGAALALALSNAVTEELLLRFFLFTAVLAVAVRLLPRQRWAPIPAIVVATLADLALHLPAVAAYGLPGAGAIAAYVAARLAIPAVVFGWLYWRRGLGTTVTAHATANAVVGVMAL